MEKGPRCGRCDTPMKMEDNETFYGCPSGDHTELISRKFFRKWEEEQRMLKQNFKVLGKDNTTWEDY